MSKITYSQTIRAQRANRAPYGGATWQPRPDNRPPDDLTQGQRSSGVHDQAGGHFASGASSAAAASDPSMAGQSTSEPRTLQSHGTHYALPPDPQKNAKLKRTAEVEQSEYERHKAEKREQIAQVLGQQTPARVGGPWQSREDIAKMRQKQERRQQVDARFEKVRKRERYKEYHRQRREKEEEELRKMKQVQREKAERKKARDKEVHQSQLDEMRRKRLERFDPDNNNY